MKSVRFLGKAALILSLAVAAQTAFAQYRQVNLVSTSSNTTPFKDPNLVNGWGVASSPVLRSGFPIMARGNPRSTISSAISSRS